MQLLLTAQSDLEMTEMNNLVARWRWAMRVGATPGNSIMNCGLLDTGDGMSGGGSIGLGGDSLQRRTMSVSVPGVPL